MRYGRLFVISGPSGVGKSSLINDTLNDLSGFAKSISVTTRPKRKNEITGKQYRFVNREEFKDLIKKDSFLEWASYCNYLYGTPKKFVMDQLNAGKNIILEIEVKGAMQVKSKIKDAFLIFITVASMKQLEERISRLKNRLVKRGTDDADEIKMRMNVAKNELKYEKYYNCIIVNNNYNEALINLKHVLLSQRGGKV